MRLGLFGAPALLLASLVCVAFVFAACGDDEQPDGRPGPGLAASVTPTALTVTSSAFEDGGPIDARYHCSDAGLGVSPPLSWTGAPDGTKSFAITMNDPGGLIGDFTHWIVFAIPSDVTSLEEDAANKDLRGGKHALNNIQRAGYLGPCIQAGDTAQHTYTFRVLALDYVPDFEVTETFRSEFDLETRAHILAVGQLTGVVTP